MHLIRADNFNLHQIANSGQCFRMLCIREGVYSVVSCGKYLELYQIGDLIFLGCSEDEYENFWSDYFDMKTDYSKIAVNTDDEFLNRAIEFGNGIRILQQDLFELIISFIISQRKNITSIKLAIDLLCRRFGEKFKGIGINANEVDAYAFPTAEALVNAPYDELAECGLGYRTRYIKAAAEWFLEWEKNKRDLSYNILVSEILGVGAKVANCICLFGLHQLEFCPIDVWVKRIFDEEYGGGIPSWATSEYAGVYQQYCFYYKRNQKG